MKLQGPRGSARSGSRAASSAGDAIRLNVGGFAAVCAQSDRFSAKDKSAACVITLRTFPTPPLVERGDIVTTCAEIKVSRPLRFWAN